MNTIRLNITLPAALNEDMNNFALELGDKKSHIISSALEMYFDYLDIRLAEKRGIVSFKASFLSDHL